MEKRESWSIIIAILTMTIILYFPKLLGDANSIGIANSFIISGLIILTSISTKIFIARILDDSVAFKIWEFKKFWITYHAEFKKPVPIGVLLPVILSFFSTGKVKFLTLLEYESKALTSKVAKKYGQRRFSGVMEWDDSLIVFYSIIAVLALACLVSFIGTYIPGRFFIALPQISLYYILANLIPFSRLDGMKLLMGSKPLYVFTLIVLILAALFIFF